VSRSSQKSPAPATQPARGRGGGRPRLYASAAEKQKAYRRRLQAKAAAYDALTRVTATPEDEEDKPQTGPELFAALAANGFIGALAGREDIGDSVEYARQLRERAWTRRQE
jgi:hypothetical protein